MIIRFGHDTYVSKLNENSINTLIIILQPFKISGIFNRVSIIYYFEIF